MTVNDFFNSSFTENMRTVSLTEILLTLTLSLCIGLFIYLIYKKTSTTMYSERFGVTLVMLCLITTATVLAGSSNIMLSVVMIAVFSIVRFRTAFNEYQELVFMLWAISTGIILASGMIPLAVICSCVIGIVLLVFTSRKSNAQQYNIVLNCESMDAETNARTYLEQCVTKSYVKRKIAVQGATELEIVVYLKGDNSELISHLSEMPGVNRVAIDSYDGI